MGRIPVFLYDDVPWIPYEGSDIDVHTFGFAGGLVPYGNHTIIDKTIEKISKLSRAEYQQKMEALKNVRRFYTYQGVFEQFEKFLVDPFGAKGGCLRCIDHPRTEKCCDDPSILNMTALPNYER
jgi:hypothetical protein